MPRARARWVEECEWGVPAAGNGPRAAAAPHRRGGRVDLALRRPLDSMPGAARSRLVQNASSPEQRIPPPSARTMPSRRRAARRQGRNQASLAGVGTPAASPCKDQVAPTSVEMASPRDVEAYQVDPDA